MKTLTDFDFKNKKAIIRVDFNVPGRNLRDRCYSNQTKPQSMLF
jgi:3-phosphoglycerate kinase